MLFDISFPGFREELDLLGTVNPSLQSYFLSLVNAGTAVSAAKCRHVETAFDGAYEIWILSYSKGTLEIYCRVQNGVLAFSSILRP